MCRETYSYNALNFVVSFKVVGNLTTTNYYVDNWCPAAFKGT